MTLLSLNRLLSWARDYTAVAAVSAAGIVAAGFLATSIMSDVRGDAGKDRESREPQSVGSAFSSNDFSAVGNAVGNANRSSPPVVGTRIASLSEGDNASASLSLSADASGYIDTYFPRDPTWRNSAAEPETASADRRRGGDPLSRDDKDNARDIDEDPALDEEPDEEPYSRNEMIGGRVISDSGTALIGVGVTATAIHLFDVPPGVTVPVGDLQRHAVSDTAGQYRFDQLAAGEYRVNNVPTDRYGMTQISVRSGVDFADLVLKDQRQFNVSGIVTDTAGQPLAGALVQPQFIGGRGAYTGTAGRFDLRLQIQERAKGLGIRTALYGYRDKTTLLSTSNSAADLSAPIMIRLEKLEKHAVVSGLLRSAADGTPVTGKTVQLHSAANRQRYHATSNVDGRFQMIAVEANMVYELLVAGGGGFAMYLQPNVTVSENGLELDLLLDEDESRELKGRMVNLNGAPIPNFSLIARAAKPPYQVTRVISDAAGNFVLRNAPQSPLVFESQSMPQLHISGVQVPTISGQTVVLTLDVGRDEIYGLVFDSNGAPVAVPNVVASWRHVQNGIASSSTRRAAADAQGGFSFRNLGPGVHTITVDATGYEPVRVEHDVASDGYEFTIRLEPISSGS